jgi:hypothetical protein
MDNVKLVDVLDTVDKLMIHLARILLLQPFVLDDVVE